MNTNQTKHLTATACFGFALFCTLWVVLTFLLLPFNELHNDYSILVTHPSWTLATSMGLGASILGIFAVFGVYAQNHSKGGVLLLVGMVLLVLGLVLETVALCIDTIVWPVLCSYPRFLPFIREGFFIASPQFAIFSIALMATLFTGSVLMAVGLVKANRYGKVIPLLMVIGVVLYGVGNFVLLHLAFIGLTMYGVAFALIGLREVRG